MKNVYCISYQPGMFGEFLCSQIAKDSNYHPNLGPTVSSSLKNRYKFRSILDHLIWTLFEWPEVPTYVNDLVNNRFADKHTLLRSHYYGENATMNFDRLVKVKLYCEENQWLLPLLLLVIKVWPMTTAEASGTPVEMSEYWMYPMINEHVIDPVKRDTLFNNIGSVSAFEMDMIRLGFQTTRQLVEYKVSECQMIAPINSGGNWIYLNPTDLLTDPATHMATWRDTFDLTQDFDFELLTSYHTENLNLIQQEFGKTYEELLQGDYVTDITNYCERMRFTY